MASETYGLDFVPAERTRGGFEYKILEIPEPRGDYFVSMGFILWRQGYWKARKWRKDGRCGDEPSPYDLVPAPKHRYIAAFCSGSASYWYDSLESLVKAVGGLAVRHIIHEITHPDGRIEIEVIMPEESDG